VHYYQHNIKQFNNATRHCTRVERSLYRDAIELYYHDEQPFTTDLGVLSRRLMANTDEEKTALKYVLSEFFYRDGDVYRQDRCDEEITKYYNAKANHWATKLTKPQRAAIQAARNAAKISATPPWLSIEQKLEIAGIYADAAILSIKTGVPYHVDHIVPLRNKIVCGLHVPWNLRAIPAHENQRKSNKLEFV